MSVNRDSSMQVDQVRIPEVPSDKGEGREGRSEAQASCKSGESRWKSISGFGWGLP